MTSALDPASRPHAVRAGLTSAGRQTATGVPGLRHRPSAPTRRPTTWTPELLEKVEWRARAAAEPFRGVTSPDGLVEALFPLRPTGIDMRPVRTAAEAYLAALTHDELRRGLLPMGDTTWRHWANGARYFLRHGLCLEELAPEKRSLALAMVRASLSDAGFLQVLDLMHLNLTVGELRGEEDLLNEWLYWVTVYGSPEDGVWGWQLDGHHVNINCVFVGDQMTLTPTFLGAEPVHADAGKYAGTTVFRPEESIGLELFTSLSARQRASAVIAEQMPEDLFVGAFRDNFELRYEGLRLAEMTSTQSRTAAELIGLYVDRAPRRHAEVRMDEVTAHWGETHFAWVGSEAPDGVFYYRVHSPVILIEFEHQTGVMFDNDTPSRNHIHTIVRTPNGGDYGADLLRQHHERFH